MIQKIRKITLGFRRNDDTSKAGKLRVVSSNGNGAISEGILSLESDKFLRGHRLGGKSPKAFLSVVS